MTKATQQEFDTRAFNGRWCEHCRCQVIAARVTDTGNHRSCGKATEFLPLIVLPVRDFAPAEQTVQDEADHLREMLNNGGIEDQNKFNMAYAAYNALLFVLDNRIEPPSQAYK